MMPERLNQSAQIFEKKNFLSLIRNLPKVRNLPLDFE
jgi:hypothetical protein